jgi:hypothetical protein
VAKSRNYIRRVKEGKNDFNKVCLYRIFSDMTTRQRRLLFSWYGEGIFYKDVFNLLFSGRKGCD